MGKIVAVSAGIVLMGVIFSGCGLFCCGFATPCNDDNIFWIASIRYANLAMTKFKIMLFAVLKCFESNSHRRFGAIQKSQSSLAVF